MAPHDTGGLCLGVKRVAIKAEWSLCVQALLPLGVPKGCPKGKTGGFVNANRTERSRGRPRLHGQGMGKTQDHRSRIEQRWAVGGGWRLAVGGWRSLGAVLNRKTLGCLKAALGVPPMPAPAMPAFGHPKDREV